MARIDTRTAQAAGADELLEPLATGLNPDGSAFTVQQTGMVSKWRDEFSVAAGSTPSAAEWTISTSGTGATVSMSGSNLTLNPGATAAGYAEVTSKRAWYPGVRLYTVLNQISQRIVNQETYIEFVEDGAAAGGASGNDRVRWEFTATTATNGSLRSWAAGDAGTAQGVAVNTTASPSVFELDLGHEEAWGYNTVVDSSAGRLGSGRISRKVPDPNKKYRLRLGIRNTGALSGTTVTFDSVLVEDYTFLPVELVRGRGSAAAGEALPVAVTTAPQGNASVVGSVIPVATAGSVGAMNLNSKRASNDGTGVVAKTTAGRIYGWDFFNTAGTIRYLKFFNKASTAPALGTDVPTMTIPIAAGGTARMMLADLGFSHSAGIGYAITTGAADLDTVASGTGEVLGSVFYS